jgi:hypothetical protein
MDGCYLSGNKATIPANVKVTNEENSKFTNEISHLEREMCEAENIMRKTQEPVYGLNRVFLYKMFRRL